MMPKFLCTSEVRGPVRRNFAQKQRRVCENVLDLNRLLSCSHRCALNMVFGNMRAGDDELLCNWQLILWSPSLDVSDLRN